MHRLISLLTYLAVVSSNELVGKCSFFEGDIPLSFEIVGCSSTPCLMHQDEDAVVKVNFNAPHDSMSLTSLLTGFFSFGQIEFPINIDLGVRSQACDALTNTTCPVTSGQTVEYTLKMPVEKYYAIGTTLAVELRIVDDIRTPAFCARTSVVIASPREYANMTTP